MKPKRPVSEPEPVLVVLSDLHCGSTQAIIPEGFVTAKGNEIGQNVIQKWLWDCWIRANNFIDTTVGTHPFSLVLNGDLIDGDHHGTKEIWSKNINDHVSAARDLLLPLSKRAKKTFICEGTECHVNDRECSIGAILNTVRNPENDTHAFARLTLDVHGVRCVFRHHIGTSMRRNLAATQLGITLAEEQLEAACNGEPIPRIVGCAHRHKPGYYQDDNGLCFVSPAWQVLTRFGHKVVSAARCKPGVQILDWRGKAKGELPTFHRRYYDAPQPNAISI